jgi:hypothetical protein
MLFFRKCLQFTLGLIFILCLIQPDAATASGATGGQDQLEGLRVGDTLQLTERDGNPGSGGILEVTVVNANGKVENFRITRKVVDQNGNTLVIDYLYTWFDGCYYPPWMVWHRYCFTKSSPGIYKYEKYNTNNARMESGSGIAPSKQPPRR